MSVNFLGILIDLDLHYIAPETLGNDAPDSRGSLRKLWWPKVMTDPGLFNATLLISASHQASITSMRRNRILIEELRCNTIASVNESMADPNPRLSDVNIGAILTLGSWEFYYGDPNAYKMHMSGLQTMIAMRGGLEKGRFQDILVKLILSVGHDLTLFAGIPPFFDTVRSSSGHASKLILPIADSLLPGFARLDKINLPRRSS